MCFIMFHFVETLFLISWYTFNTGVHSNVLKCLSWLMLVSCYFIFFDESCIWFYYIPYNFWTKVVIFTYAEYLSTKNHLENLSGIFMALQSTVPSSWSSVCLSFVSLLVVIVPWSIIDMHGHSSHSTFFHGQPYSV